MTTEGVLVPRVGTAMCAGVVVDDGRAERRRRANRRRFSWRTVCFGFVHSRRCKLRRAWDVDALYLDWHHPWLFFLVVGTMLMSCMDAVMTLKLLELGMVEVNPVMAAAIRHSTTSFAVSKVALTGSSLLILTYFSRTRLLNRLRTGVLLTVFFSCYASLVCYQFVHLAGRA